MTQLLLFTEPDKPSYNFWKDCFGFEAKIGDKARIDEPIAFCESMGKDEFCFGMEVNVIDIKDDFARVETTQELEDLCKKSNTYTENSPNKSGNIWHIKLKNLAPSKQ